MAGVVGALTGRVRAAFGGGRAEALRQEVRAQATEDRLHAQRNYDELLLALSRMEETIGLLGTQISRLRAEVDGRGSGHPADDAPGVQPGSR